MFGRYPKALKRLAIVIGALTFGSNWACAGHGRVSSAGKPAPPASNAPKSLRPEQVITDLETFLRRDDLNRSMRAQAMFRLAALKDDLARERGVPLLTPSIVLYMQIIRDFSDSDIAAPSHYFLAHALLDSGRIDEAQHVFRALVCRNHFPFVPPQDAGGFSVPRLPQDHDRSFWQEWESQHLIPFDKLPPKKTKTADDETEFVNPYPQDCQAMARTTPPGQTPRYIGEAWWRIGDHHFAEMDPLGGPYNFNRAATAYRHAVRYGNSLIRTLAMYKLAWTYFKQQRYEAAVEQFVELLRLIEAQQSQTGNSEGNFRKEACTYIAGSLTYIDFRGPGANDPFIARNDVLDTEKDPRVAEQKMHVAIDRVRDAKIIPQNEAWTSDIYLALIGEFRQLLQYRNMLETSEFFLARWPSDPRAAEVRRGIDEARKLRGLSSGP